MTFPHPVFKRAAWLSVIPLLFCSSVVSDDHFIEVVQGDDVIFESLFPEE